MHQRSRWDEVHVRQDAATHALRINHATYEALPDEGNEPAELEQLRWARWVQTEARAAGASWTTVGAIFGTTRQAAQQRFGHLDR